MWARSASCYAEYQTVPVRMRMGQDVFGVSGGTSSVDEDDNKEGDTQ